MGLREFLGDALPVGGAVVDRDDRLALQFLDGVATERATEMERLVAFGSALGSALDVTALRQVFWRYLPAFTREAVR